MGSPSTFFGTELFSEVSLLAQGPGLIGTPPIGRSLLGASVAFVLELFPVSYRLAKGELSWGEMDKRRLVKTTAWVARELVSRKQCSKDMARRPTRPKLVFAFQLITTVLYYK